ncbi:programmed cell death protein 6-like [Liolophura sinensis]|uniref:programmed cell death protein 6-like n=1 Tax=Liolophura sinensis TaxID=3198878 RepID=UPI00315934D3
MSWGQPTQQPYGGYGQGAYGTNRGYGGPPAQAYGQQYGGGAQQQYGYGPPPQQNPYGAQGYGGRPPVPAYSAPPAGPPPGINPELWSWFQSVDQDRSGRISADELQRALVNSNWSQFNSETCRLMIGMFDKDRSGTIDIHEFAALWKYIQEWKSCFDRFDTDRSGNIDAGELNNAFNAFGYRLSPQFCQLVVRVFDKRSTTTIQFDDFIQACVMLKSLTDKFRAHDVQQQGVIHISYEQFLEMVLDNTLS